MKLGTDLFVRRGQEVWRWLVTTWHIANKELTGRTNHAHALPRINKKCSQLQCARPQGGRPSGPKRMPSLPPSVRHIEHDDLIPRDSECLAEPTQPENRIER